MRFPHKQPKPDPVTREPMLLVDTRFQDPRRNGVIARLGRDNYALRIHHPTEDRSITIWWDGTITADEPARPN